MFLKTMLWSTLGMLLGKANWSINRPKKSHKKEFGRGSMEGEWNFESKISVFWTLTI